MSEIVLVTGMSGAGRSTASAALEDLGWFVIDNLPLELVGRVSDLAGGGVEYPGVALVVGRGGRVPAEAVLGVVQDLRTRQGGVRIVFLDAPDDVLIQRYESSRRRHPYPAPSLADAITGERAAVQVLRDAADLVIDTSTTNPNQLRSRIQEYFSTREGPSMRVSVVSFGFSHGMPRDVDLVFDCRFLPNPHWIDELRPLTGLDQAVASYVLTQEPAQHLISDIVAMLGWQLPAFAREGKAYLSVAVGCTGGRHRSVAVAEEIARRLPVAATVYHRDIAR
ncbi:MAG: RNase adapter RapZ [Acidimicrobiales bacterium]